MKNITVLVVDDEKNLLVLLERVLKKEGYEVLSAANAEEALQVMDQSQVDIVLTDIKMPGMDGITLMDTIKKTDDSIEVIIMTAFATLDTAINALKMGARDYIRKPFDIDEVVDAVHNASFMVETPPSALVPADNIPKMLIDNSQPMKDLVALIKKVAASMATVYIHGETGVGKELVARAIHELSDRKKQPFIKVNCSALPETLLESELFGYEKGAFTGAFARKPGRFELANKGTIFLDEIGDISPLIQLKLLRIIQQKEVERLGGTETLSLDVRIITATNKDLEQLVKKGAFREDLYYRLNVIPLNVPPLRERKEDFEPLVQTFIETISRTYGSPMKVIQPEAMAALKAYTWPGNVRELENIIERLMVISEGKEISLSELPEKIVTCNSSCSAQSLDMVKDLMEEKTILEALKQSNGNITQAAARLGISRRSLHRKINKYDLKYQ